MKQQVSFTAISKITLEHEQGASKSSLVETKMFLELSKNLDKNQYLDFNGLPKKEAVKPITQAFIQGLMTNVKAADKKGFWKEADHIKYIMDELQRAFTHVAYSDPKITDEWFDKAE